MEQKTSFVHFICLCKKICKYSIVCVISNSLDEETNMASS